MVTVKKNFTTIESWLANPEFTANEVILYTKAIHLAQKYYTNNTFYPTSVTLFNHVLVCANTVFSLNLYTDAVIATILFALPKYLDTWKDELKFCDSKVIELIEGINQVTRIHKLGAFNSSANEHDKKEQIEIIRKMLLSMVSDIRVVLIVLVGRGELMLHLKSCPDKVLQKKIATETVEIFSPLANRLGVSQIKWELEDLSFKYLHPEQYRKIAKLLDGTRQERIDYIDRLKEFLSTQIKENNIAEYQITGRAKHIYSIWRKMKKKNYHFDDLYDIRALRILVPEVRDCYTVLGILHTKYAPIPGEFDDYISNPKVNNYQSLHTCVVGPDNKVIEIQIRTFAMHDHAEYGVAAHWRYKEFGDKGIDNNNAAFAQKLAWLRQLLDWRDELTERKDIADLFRNEIFSDTIYVMTPQGKVISLPFGSTAIDFAYALHTDLGHRCRGAKINGHIIQLSTPLQNGWRIEILTVKDGWPSINWVHDGWVKSTKAIAHIRRYIRNQNFEEFYDAGHEIFTRELAKVHNRIRPKTEELIQKLNYENEKSLCIAIGRGDLAPQTIAQAIEKLINKTDKFDELMTIEQLDNKIINNINKSNAGARKNVNGILVDGVSGIVTHIAKCCKPIPSDEVIGFITHGNGIAIHRTNCKCLKRQVKLFANKIIPIAWGNDINSIIFNADIQVIANDRSTLLRDITNLFAIEKLHINGFKTACKNNKSLMTFSLQIKTKDFNFNYLINKIMMVKGIISAMRK